MARHEGEKKVGSERKSERRGGETHVSPVSVAKHLRGIDFPASKDDLLEKARSENAGEEVIHQLERMPDQEYTSMADVMKGFGQSDEEEPQGGS
jgi:hypothetical protein